MTLCITNPIWVTKTRLVLQYEAGVDSSKRQYKGMFDALMKIYKYEGIRGLYKVRECKARPEVLVFGMETTSLLLPYYHLITLMSGVSLFSTLMND